MISNGNDHLEGSMLRSILLFKNRVKTANGKNPLYMAVFSIIASNENGCTRADISNLLSSRFKIKLDDEEFKASINKLKNEKLIDIRPDGTYASANVAECNAFFEETEKVTEQMINGVLERLKKNPTLRIEQLPLTTLIRIRNNIKKALSHYFHMFGYAFVGLKQTGDRQQNIDALELAREGLDKNLGDSLIGAIADLIDSPDEQEREVLQMWARAYVAMEVVNLDPKLREFKQGKLRNCQFVVDTDFMLYCLTRNARFSKEYRTIAHQLQGCGCQVMFPTPLRREITDHIDAAWKWHGSSGAQWATYTTEMIDVMGNIFVEDYIMTVRNEDKADMPFRVYINNLHSPDDLSLLDDNINEALGRGCDRIDEFESLDEETRQKLAELIKEQTENSAKGTKRDDDGNRIIADNDAGLYMTVQNMNETTRTYLLTQSQKIKSSAKKLGIYKKDIICDPRALLAILHEIGLISSDSIDFINLFENPFLVHTAKFIKEETDELLKQGAELKYAELKRLRIDVDAHIGRILTSASEDERRMEVTRVSERGYEFVKQLHAANERADSLEDQLAQTQKEKDELTELVDKLKAARAKDRYEQRVGRLTGKSGKSSKKRK